MSSGGVGWIACSSMKFEAFTSFHGALKATLLSSSSMLLSVMTEYSERALKFLLSSTICSCFNVFDFDSRTFAFF